ncbi:putative Nbs-lrr resistance protein [Cinnamomum micranthum f. kanehirae]|uniref:Putative Nbs-lrr resistance protein n=1 Tax=Cinnamomum micranthum f. kanehirae TaxID=337451 RepID=A0A443P6B3_9MAGN|nr:putative Nbs-lrr resistance protein [Cinnamomum micranthum f. kanehirae]
MAVKKENMENAPVSIVLKELYDLAKDERQQVTKKAVRDWLAKLKEVAYEVEDILDEWRTDAFRSQRDKDDIHFGKKVHPYLLFPCICFKKVESRHDTGHKIREITERLNKIPIEKSAFNFNEGNTWEGKSSSDIEQRQTGSLIDKTKIFVRDQDKESIVNELVCANGQEKPFSIVSIVGMGGLGKTTLTKLVCNDERVIKHFKKIIWVYVSDRFDLNQIAKKIILSMSGSSCENLDFDTLQHSLHEVVGKMQFLLVLDDVWNENHSEWEKLKVPLNGAAQGSRIVVTTRSRKVAEVMEATHIHNLGILSNLDCWKLFTYEAFKGREEEKYQELTEVGMEIVHKCKGVPLAVVTVGSLLRHEKKKLDWKFILESEIWEWKTPKDEGMLPSLLLSYYKLPLHLKPCFLFCSVFPKDHNIKKDELVKLWMAHGIIKSERAEIEEIGEKYFDDLLTRSLFQDAQEDDSGNIIQCKMHDLVHNLAKFVTSSAYCIKEIGNSNLCSDSSHHLSLLVNYDASIIPSLMCKRLRTLLLFGPSRIKEGMTVYSII